MSRSNQLTKAYRSGRRALESIDLAVAQGELVVGLGPNGSGKSTLLRCAVRLIEPTAGSVRVAGQDLARLSDDQLRQARRRVGMIFQHGNLVRRRSALANVATGSLGRHHDWRTAILPRAFQPDIGHLPQALSGTLETLEIALCWAPPPSCSRCHWRSAQPKTSRLLAPCT